MFQTKSNYEKRPFPWMVVLLAVQILLLALILLVWAARLVKRGKHLARNPDEERSTEENETCSDFQQQHPPPLIQGAPQSATEP